MITSFRVIHYVSAIAGVVAYLWLSIDTLAHYTQDASGVVLGWALLLFALICAVSLFAGLAWRVASGAVNATAAGYVVFYDLFRTPVRQLVLDACVGVICLIEIAVAGYFLVRWYRESGRSRIAVGSLLALIPALALFGAWNTYAFSPHRARPVVTITTSFGGTKLIDDASGDPDHVAVSGTITVRNVGDVDADLAGSLYKITTVTSANASRPISPATAASFESEIQQAIDDSHAVEPLGRNLHRLSGFWPTSDPSENLLQLDEITPSSYYLAPRETYVQGFTVDVPLLTENPITKIEIQAEVISLNSPPTDVAFRACNSGSMSDDGHLTLQQNGSHGAFSCIETPLRSRTPFGAWSDDDPTMQVYLCVGDPAVPGSESGALLAGFSTHAPPRSVADVQRLLRYAPVSMATTAAALEVNALAAGP